jgi:hypothetical protein
MWKEEGKLFLFKGILLIITFFIQFYLSFCFLINAYSCSVTSRRIFFKTLCRKSNLDKNFSAAVYFSEAPSSSILCLGVVKQLCKL